MHFAFSDQQSEFKEAVRQVLTNECTPDDVRVAFDHPEARSPRWSALAQLGLVGLLVPSAHGGLGLGLVDLVPLLEEAGRVALPEPLLETAALAAPLLAECEGAEGSDGSEESAPSAGLDTGTWLAAIAHGDVAAAVGSVRTATTNAHPEAIAAADGADLLVLFLPEASDGPEVHLVGSAQAKVVPVTTLDPTRRLGVPQWEPTSQTRLMVGPAAASAMRRTADRGALATAAELLGLTDRMITLAADYAKARHQFGKPIGSFQAVKHLLANAQVRLEFARPAVYGAAWSLDEGEPTASRSVSVAKAYASDAATEAAAVSLQVFGAIGYTWECDLHLYLKRAWALAEAWGSAAEHRGRVLASLVADR